MRWFLSLLILFAPALAAAQTVPPGYRMVCRNGVCGLVRIQAAPQYAPTVYGVGGPIVQNAIYTNPAPTIASSFAEPPAPDVPVVVSGTVCNCAVTGVCTCSPASCVCPSCRNGQIRMGSAYAAPVTYTATYTTPAATYTAMQVLSSGATIQMNSAGGVWVSHPAGRRATRWLARGVRNGWQQ